jgi:phosphate acetyltransferase
MAQNIYITGAEQGSGKSVIVLAMMDTLSGHGAKPGFFRPVVHPETPDPLIQLVAARYQLDCDYADMYGCTSDLARQLIADNRYDELLKRILVRYRELQGRCDRVLCAGTDYRNAHTALEFDFNADIANNLGCFILPVVPGRGRSQSDIQDATGAFLTSLKERGCDILAAIVNGVTAKSFDALQAYFGNRPAGEIPVYVVPDNPTLSKPTLGNIASELHAELLYGDVSALNRTVQDYKIAAMHIPDFLDYLKDESLIITPGDRADIILASVMAHRSSGYPRVAGLLLTGNQKPAPQLLRLLNGLGQPPFAILGVAGDTFTTALAVSQVSAMLTPENEHMIAAALGTVEAHVDLDALEQSLATRRSTRVTPLMFEYELVQRARRQKQHIVLPEGSDERILQAVEILSLRGVAKLTLLGDVDEIRQKIDRLGLHPVDVDIVDPQQSTWRQEFADIYFELRKHKGISPQMAFDTLADVSYFGTLMVYTGKADGMVSGAMHTTQHTIRPAFEVIKTRPGTAIVSSVFLMCLADRVLVYGDCAVNPEPDAQQLADIAIASADTAQMFGIEPRVAMLSYSTGTSGKGQAVDKVRAATELAQSLRPSLKIEGPIQYDAAVDASVARTKRLESEVAGNATVFVFPDLNTGNNTYKAVQRSAGAVAVGPVLQGLNKPVNDLSRGCSVADIVNTVAITAIQAQSGTTTA